MLPNAQRNPTRTDTSASQKRRKRPEPEPEPEGLGFGHEGRSELSSNEEWNRIVREFRSETSSVMLEGIVAVSGRRKAQVAVLCLPLCDLLLLSNKVMA